MPRRPAPLLVLLPIYLFLYGYCGAGPLQAQDLVLKSHPSRWRLTAERFEADSNNDLGLLGANYDLLDIAPELLPGGYVGVGGYGAVSGTTGGLFFGGPTIGWLKELYPGWSLDLGVAAGGGGGGGADTGDGLFVRPHVALEYAIGLAAVRLELARLDFPSGDIEDTHFAFGLSLPGELLTADLGSLPGRIPAKDVLWRRMRITPSLKRIYAGSDDDKTNGGDYDDDVDLAVLGVDYFLTDTIFLPIELGGAIGGGIGGFAAALTGLGGSWPIVQQGVRLEAKALAGAGGGGDADTGGGFLWSAASGFTIALGPASSLHLLGGYFDAPDGDLDGLTATLGVSWNPRSAELDFDYDRKRLETEALPGALAELKSTRIDALHKTYFPASSAKKKDGSDLEESMQLIGAGLSRPVSLFGEDFALTARLFTAWEGESGGYAEGTAGLQYEISPFANARFHTVVLRGELGAGGGGDVDAGSGLIYHLAAGWRFQYSDALALSADIGSVESDRGSFEGESLTLGLSFVVGRPMLRD